ncbi:MAG: CDP-alcohol phosphatidyltransferase family protein [Acidimicrobiia bacterium]
MIDRRLRAAVDRPVSAVGVRLAGVGVGAEILTLVGLVFGIGACVALADDRRWMALTLWLANRLVDGIDGAVARVVGPTDRGGFIDIVSDFAVYGGFVVAVAYARPDARVACVALLCAYYVSGAAFLAWSSMAEKRARIVGDNRSLHFVGGIAEGAETIVVYVLLCVWPSATVEIVWTFTVAVAITALQRIWFAWQTLTPHDA